MSTNPSNVGQSRLCADDSLLFQRFGEVEAWGRAWNAVKPATDEQDLWANGYGSRVAAFIMTPAQSVQGLLLKWKWLRDHCEERDDAGEDLAAHRHFIIGYLDADIRRLAEG